MPCYSGKDRDGVEAIACRRSFYIDAVRSADYCDLGLGEEEPDSNGGRRRRLGINEAYPEQYIAQCLPRIVIFPQITAQDQSTLKPIGRVVLWVPTGSKCPTIV